MHSGADLGFGGTLGPRASAGVRDLWEAQGVWGWLERAESISYRELKAIRLLLKRQQANGELTFGERLKTSGVRQL